MAPTDKIFAEFSCNGQAMGLGFEASGKPEMKFALNRTASIKRVTLVRNETKHHVRVPNKRNFKAEFTDAAPPSGENRYYLRVEPDDGNMAWCSPVWVTVKTGDHRTGLDGRAPRR